MDSHLGYKSVKTEKDKIADAGRAAIAARQKQIGDKYVGLKANRVGLDVWRDLIADMLAHWVPATKGKAHKGGIGIETPHGLCKIRQGEDLAEFLNLGVLSNDEIKYCRQTLGKFLQPIGCLYVKFGRNAKAACEAIEPLLNRDKKGPWVTPRGWYDRCREMGANVLKPEASAEIKAQFGFLAPIAEKKATSEDDTIKAMLNRLTFQFGLLGLTAHEAAERKAKKADVAWTLVSADQAHALYKTLEAALGRFGKQEAREIAEAPDGAEPAMTGNFASQDRAGDNT